MAEVQNFSFEKATKESLRALAMGWEVEKRALNPAVRSLKDMLGFYAFLETPKVIKKVDAELKKTAVIFQRRR